eukprot:945379_1
MKCEAEFREQIRSIEGEVSRLQCELEEAAQSSADVEVMRLETDVERLHAAAFSIESELPYAATEVARDRSSRTSVESVRDEDETACLELQSVRDEDETARLELQSV